MIIKNSTGLGLEVLKEDLVNDFPAPEGELNMYYGQIGSGKTYGATSDILDELRKGRVVYATWPIKVEDFDDRGSLFLLFLNTILFRKRFYKVLSTKNFHYIDAETGKVDGEYVFNPSRNSEYIEFLNSLNHCSLYIDEAWRVIDSYMPTRDFGTEVRSLILVTRHKYRTINLIAQRPNSIQVTARANVNRFYKFKKMRFLGWIYFARFEFQDMSGETVDEEKEPLSVKRYFGSKRVFDAYNSYFYGDLNPLHSLKLQAFDLRLHEKLIGFWRWFRGSVKRN